MLLLEQVRKDNEGKYSRGSVEEDEDTTCNYTCSTHRQSEGMQRGTGDLITPLSRQAAQQHTHALASTSVIEVWIVTQISDGRGEISEEEIRICVTTKEEEEAYFVVETPRVILLSLHGNHCMLLAFQHVPSY